MYTNVQYIVNKIKQQVLKIRKEKKKVSPEDKWTYHKTKTGNYYLPIDAPNDIIAKAILNDEIFDAEIYHLAKKYIKPNSIVLDIGSNFGQMAIMMSKHVGTEGAVYAFEANAFVYETLKKNIKANNAPVVPCFGAVHNKSGETLFFSEVDFKEFPTYGSYGIDYANNKGAPIKSVKIDDISFNKIITFIKIDVQGGDLLAMQGAVETIKKHQCPIVFEFEYLFQEKLGLCFQDYVDFVESIGYYFAYIPKPDDFLILPKGWRKKDV
jgi:FkbM family methyltransferase